MVISVRKFFFFWGGGWGGGDGLFEFLALIFTSKQRKCRHLQSIKYLDKLVGLNILPANFIGNLLPPRDKQQQHENSDE